MSDPIRVDWVDLASVPGLRGVAKSGGALGMTFTPGKRDWGLTGKHSRDLAADIATLRDEHRITTFVWLIEDHELPILRVERLPDAMAAAGIGLVRHPIPDMDVPGDVGTFRAFLDDVHVRLARGERIAVACRGGCGRTGTVVGCLLRNGGLGPQQAIDETRKARSCAIETSDQKRFVRDWGTGR